MTSVEPYYSRNGITLYHGNCLNVLPLLGEAVCHMVFADLPYGTTYCKWDTVIPLAPLWSQLRRLVIGNGAMVFTANQPFTTTLIASNIDQFSHEWVWDKENAGNFANSSYQPLKQHENVVVFANGRAPYYPIKTPGRPNHKQGSSTTSVSETRLITERVADDLSGMKHPKSILYFPKHSSQCKHHPAQKPVSLLEYLVRTYTADAETVLDPAVGSGSALVAAANCGRRGVGVEIEERFCEIAAKRLDATSPA